MPKRFLALILCCLFIFTFSACSDNDISGKTFRLDIESDPSNLDPQMTIDSNSLLVLENSMEGLFKVSSDGSLENALCESYNISDDGLKYTFKIKSDIFWSDYKGNKVKNITAHDFVFALKRLLNPQTNSPYAHSFSIIKYADEVLSGTTPIQKLGVYPVNEYTFCIELEAESPSFLQLLATYAAYPCNEELFDSTLGKYGLENDTLLYSGPFILSTWAHSESLVLKRNPNYYDAASVLPSRLTINVVADTATYFDRFSNNNSDIVPVATNQIGSINISKTNNFPYDDTVWILAFNNSDKNFSDKTLRAAFSLALNKDLYKSHLPEWLSLTERFIPPVLTVGGKKLVDYDNNTQTKHEYSAEQARILYENYLETNELSKLPNANILCPKDDTQTFIAQYIQKSWQDTFGIFNNLEPLENDELMSLIKSGNFTFAIFPIKASSNNPISIFSNFKTNSSTNYIGYKSDLFDSIYNSADSVASEDELPNLLNELEFLLLDDSAFIPLYYQTNYYLVADNISGIRFTPFGGHFNFKYAGKAD